MPRGGLSQLTGQHSEAITDLRPLHPFGSIRLNTLVPMLVTYMAVRRRLHLPTAHPLCKRKGEECISQDSAGETKPVRNEIDGDKDIRRFCVQGVGLTSGGSGWPPLKCIG